MPLVERKVAIFLRPVEAGLAVGVYIGMPVNYKTVVEAIEAA